MLLEYAFLDSNFGSIVPTVSGRLSEIQSIVQPSRSDWKPWRISISITFYSFIGKSLYPGLRLLFSFGRTFHWGNRVFCISSSRGFSHLPKHIYQFITRRSCHIILARRIEVRKQRHRANVHIAVYHPTNFTKGIVDSLVAMRGPAFQHPAWSGLSKYQEDHSLGCRCQNYCRQTRS